MYPSDCNSPGTSRHSYVHRLTATRSSRAHRRNHAASPGSPRVRCRAAFLSAPVLPSASSARSTKSSSGILRPNSTDSTVCFENRTRVPNSTRLSPACSRRAWTTAPNVRRLSDGSGSRSQSPAAPSTPTSPPTIVIRGHLQVRAWVFPATDRPSVTAATPYRPLRVPVR